MKLLGRDNVLNFLDTSAILNGALDLYDNVCVSPLAIAELENIKTSIHKDDNLKYKARQAVRAILANNKINILPVSRKQVEKIFKEYPFLMNINDHYLLCEAVSLNRKKAHINFVTSDGALYEMARYLDIKEVTYLNEPEKEQLKEAFYCGYGKYYPTNDELITLYSEGLNQNVLNAKVNEYCEIFDADGNLADILRWDGKSYQRLRYTNIENKTLGIKVAPRNLNQKMMFDLLQNPNIPIKLITGVYGSGKDYCALIHALNLIEKGKKSKLVFVRNLIDLKDTPQIGFLPNDIEQKIGWGLGPIKDILGGDEALEIFTSQDQIEAVNLGFCRGRSWENAIIYVTEGQNLTSSQIKLLISRLGEGSEIIINGDYHGQVDKEIFEKDNGIKAMQKKLVGQPMFGCIDLIKTERSKMAELATLLD